MPEELSEKAKEALRIAAERVRDRAVRDTARWAEDQRDLGDFDGAEILTQEANDLDLSGDGRGLRMGDVDDIDDVVETWQNGGVVRDFGFD